MWKEVCRLYFNIRTCSCTCRMLAQKRIVLQMHQMSIYVLMFVLFCFRALYKIKHKTWDNSKNCSKSIGLVPRQVKMCKENLDLMETVALATSVSVETCQSQFADRRWNCSSIQNVPSMSRDLVRGKLDLMRI